jgi:hypothetical protein
VGSIIISVGYLCALLYFPLQIGTSIYARGMTRRLSLLPIPFAAFVVWYTVDLVRRESNLAPICMIFCSPVAVLFLVACLMAERARRRLALPTEPPI